MWLFNYVSTVRLIYSYYKYNSSSCFLVLISGLGNFMYLGMKQGELFLGHFSILFFHWSSDHCTKNEETLNGKLHFLSKEYSLNLEMPVFTGI